MSGNLFTAAALAWRRRFRGQFWLIPKAFKAFGLITTPRNTNLRRVTLSKLQYVPVNMVTLSQAPSHLLTNKP